MFRAGFERGAVANRCSIERDRTLPTENLVVELLCAPVPLHQSKRQRRASKFPPARFLHPNLHRRANRIGDTRPAQTRRPFSRTHFITMDDEENFHQLPENLPADPFPADDTDFRAFTRREFLANTAAVGTGLVAAHWLSTTSALAAGDTAAPGVAEAAGAGGPGETIRVALQINGSEKALQLDPRVSLLDALREHLHLTGSKKGCDHGQCGACTVLVNGRRINSCLSLAVMHEGDEITTIEGLARGDDLHPVQEAFIKHDGFQCGYCTPGQICSAVACIQEGHAKTDDDIREWMSGNLCRCGAYPNIVAAVRDAAARHEHPLTPHAS